MPIEAVGQVSRIGIRRIQGIFIPLRIFPGGVVQHLLINKWWTREKPLENRKTCLFLINELERMDGKWTRLHLGNDGI